MVILNVIRAYYISLLWEKDINNMPDLDMCLESLVSFDFEKPKTNKNKYNI